MVTYYLKGLGVIALLLLATADYSPLINTLTGY